jgi:hypothetical protein
MEKNWLPKQKNYLPQVLRFEIWNS